MNDQLLPCPFCGGEAELDWSFISCSKTIKEYQVKCTKCFVHFPTEQREKLVIDMWNSRV